MVVLFVTSIGTTNEHIVRIAFAHVVVRLCPIIDILPFIVNQALLILIEYIRLVSYIGASF